MMIVAGLERPTGGTVEVAGVALGGLDEDALALFRRDNVGIVFQDFHLIGSQEIMLNPEYLGTHLVIHPLWINRGTECSGPDGCHDCPVQPAFQLSQ